MPHVKTRKQFGRELETLLSIAIDDGATQSKMALQFVSLENLHVGPHQPRQQFNEDALRELAESIKQQGILQPIVCREIAKGYEIIAGERRFRAAKIAGLIEVPIVVHNVPDTTALAFALIENIQREDLNPIEEAMALQRLLIEFTMTHEAVAKAVGRSRAAVTNLLRLLNLCDEVKAFVLSNQLDMGHARALLPLSPDEQLLLAQIIIKQQYSVRQAEALIARSQCPKVPDQLKPSDFDHLISNWEGLLAQKFRAQSSIKLDQKGGGKIILSFKSVQALEGIMKNISNFENSFE